MIGSSFMAELKKRIVKTARRRNAHVPWSKLPVELQAHIFYESTRHADERDIVLCAMAIGEVSSHWRAVVTSTPKLWCSFEVTRSVNLTRLILVRSGHLPLNVEVSARSSQSCLDVVATESHRWKSLQSTDPDQHLDVAQYIRNPLPILKKVVLDYELDIAPPFVFHFGGGDRLTNLHISNVIFTNTGSVIMSSLRRLSVRNITMEAQEFIQLVQSCPMAEELIFSNMAFNNFGIDPATFTTLHRPALRTLSIESIEEDMARLLLRVIDAENLEDIEAEIREGTPGLLESLRPGESTPTLLSRVAHKARFKRVDLTLKSDIVQVSGYIRGRVVFDFRMMEMEMRHALEEILGLFPAGRIEDPIRLGSYTRHDYPTVSQLARLPGLVTISTNPPPTDNFIPFLSYLARPQLMEDGSTEWLAPHLAEIRLGEFPPESHPFSHQLNTLVKRRGEGGDWARWQAENHRNGDDLPKGSPVPIRMYDRMGALWAPRNVAEVDPLSSTSD